MLALSGKDSLWGGDDKGSMGELQDLAQGKTKDGSAPVAQEVEAAKTLVNYYYANDGRNGANALATAGASDEKFSRDEWLTGMDTL